MRLARIRPPWGLRLRMLAPTIILVLLAGLTLHLLSTTTASNEAEVLIKQRGDTATQGIVGHLRDRQRSKEMFAQLLAQEAGVAVAVERGDSGTLASMLAPLQDKLGLESVYVHDESGGLLMHLGPTSPESRLSPLVDAARSGLTKSTSLVGKEGLATWASTPVKSGQRIVGAITVGPLQGDYSLKEIKHRVGVDLGVFQDGTLVDTTIEQPDLVRLLGGTALIPEGLTKLDKALAPLDMHAIVRPIGDSGHIVLLVHTQDLISVTSKRALITSLVSFALLLALMLAGLTQARNIVSSLDAVVAAAGEMAQGRYDRRVAPSRIRELNDLAGAVNCLGQTIETQLAELAHHAFHDSLTNLPNRALFMDRVEHALARAERYKYSVALLYLDLDNFKVVNDDLGHQTGDQLLRAVAGRIIESLRTGDTAARLGGDEFTILLEDIAGLGGAVGVAERIYDQLKEPFSFGDQEVFVSASIGIVLNSPGESSPETLLREAGLAVHRAKTNGKARYEVFEPSLTTLAAGRLELETALRHSIDRGELRLHYQPVVSIESGRIGEVEALVRWKHPRRGLLSAAEFISRAEETGLILPIGRWVIEEACRQARKWQLEYPDNPPLTVSVNLSPRQFEYPNLVEEIAQILQDTKLDPSSLKIEITETVMMQDAESSLATLHAMKALGIQLALDDFGTGYSSLAYLKHFPVDTLKIDKAFVERLGQDPRDVSIVHAVVEFARALNLTVTAEGIETPQQLSLLRALGCDQGQGYYFAKPLPSDAIEELLSSQPWVAQENRLARRRLLRTVASA